MDGFDGRSHNERYVKPHQQVQLHLWHNLQLATCCNDVGQKESERLCFFCGICQCGEPGGRECGRGKSWVVLGLLLPRLGRWTFRASISLCNFKFSQLATFFLSFFLFFRGFPLWKLRKFFNRCVCVCTCCTWLHFLDSNNICILLLFLYFFLFVEKNLFNYCDKFVKRLRKQTCLGVPYSVGVCKAGNMEACQYTCACIMMPEYFNWQARILIK